MTFSERVDICGIWVDNMTLGESLSCVETLIARRVPSFVVTPNADHMVKLQKDAEFLKIYREAALVLADGMALLWAASFLGHPIVEKVSGSDLMPEFCKVSAAKSYKLFFLGGREGAAAKAKERLERWYPSIRIVGVYSPPMGFEKDANEGRKIQAMIKEASPDVLFVGLGAPKQEKWIFNNYQQLGVPVSIGVGVTFEFIANLVKRAPRWMQKSGLEWLWRLMMEPRRLWKRYLVDDPKFFWMVLCQRLSRKKG